eukprot:TRINITY_DN6801_c9_g1_i1.p1 TRINITY_DN6801_c9_g1~~TRINITY_DN6801_c9_g1_i1.p1  ORF type:complete len:388 (+),score=51.69 TRINITY_DN6801_c9_g1_i1:119-1282(+)
MVAQGAKLHMPDVEANDGDSQERQVLLSDSEKLPSEKVLPSMVCEWASIPWFVNWTTCMTIPCSFTLMVYSISQDATWYPTAVAAIGYLLFFVLRSATGCLRYAILRWIIGVEHEAIAAIFGTKALDLDDLFKNQDKFAIRAVDGICRKSGHIVMWMAYPVLLSYVSDDGHLTISSVFGFLMTVVTVTLVPMNNTISNVYWGGCVRVWDGHLRRINELFTSQIGTFWTFVTIHVVMRLAIHPLLPPALYGLLPRKMIVIPCAIGDAMAEIIGSLFGRHFFQVSGLGEINKKTIEGCVAFVVSTMAVLVATLIEYRLTIWDRWEWYVVAMAISILGMFAETFSFRGTDNMVIMATAAAVLACGARHFHLQPPLMSSEPSLIDISAASL